MDIYLLPSLHTPCRLPPCRSPWLFSVCLRRWAGGGGTHPAVCECWMVMRSTPCGNDDRWVVGVGWQRHAGGSGKVRRIPCRSAIVAWLNLACPIVPTARVLASFPLFLMCRACSHPRVTKNANGYRKQRSSRVVGHQIWHLDFRRPGFMVRMVCAWNDL